MWAEKTKTFDPSALYIVEEFMEAGVIQCCDYCNIYFHEREMSISSNDNNFCAGCDAIVAEMRRERYKAIWALDHPK